MAVATELEKELAKWETTVTEHTPASKGLSPGNPYRPHNEFGKAGADYPRMLYKAHRNPLSGKMSVWEPEPSRFMFSRDEEYDRACQAALHFNQTCQMIVSSEEEQAKAEREGWCTSMQGALEWAEGARIERSNAAAERHYQDRKMSPEAQAEARAFDEAHEGHQPEVKESPLPPKRRGGRRSAAA